MCPYTVPDKALLRLTAHPAKRRAPPQPDVRPPLRSIGHRTRIQQARHKRGWSAPTCGLGHRPGLAGTRKGYPFLLCTPLHRHADVRLCCAGKRPKGARSPIFGHTRVSIALFRQICNSIPAQNLLTHSIKYGQTHRQKMSLPPPKIKHHPSGWCFWQSFSRSCRRVGSPLTDAACPRHAAPRLKALTAL